MAKLLPVRTSRAYFTFAKLPSPRVLPSSYFPTRVRVPTPPPLILPSFFPIAPRRFYSFFFFFFRSCPISLYKYLGCDRLGATGRSLRGNRNQSKAGKERVDTQEFISGRRDDRMNRGGRMGGGVGEGWGPPHMSHQ